METSGPERGVGVEAVPDAGALDHLLEVIGRLSLARDIRSVHAAVAKAARELARADGAAFAVCEGDGLTYAAVDGSGPAPDGRKLRMDECICGWVIGRGEAVAIADVHADPWVPEGLHRPPSIRGVIVVPVRPSRPLGAIGVYWTTSHAAAAEVQLLEMLADAAAIAIDAAGLDADSEEGKKRRAAAFHAPTAALRALLAERERAESAVRSSYDRMLEGVCILDPSGRMVYANEAAARIVRKTRAELEGRLITDLQPGFWAAAQGEACSKVLSTGTAATVDFSLGLPDGTTAAIRARAEPAAEGVLVRAVDMTSARLAEERQRYLASLLEHMNDIVVSIDLEGRIRSWNRAAEATYGWKAEEVIGKQFTVAAGVVYAEGEREALFEHVRNAGIWKGEKVHTTKSGRKIQVAATVTMVKDASGAHTGYVGVSRDISEQVRSRELAEESQRSMQEAQRLAHVGSWSLDLTAIRLTWSDEMYRILELGRETTPASYEAFLSVVHPDDRMAVDQAYTASLTETRNFAFDHRLRMRDGRVKYVHEEVETLCGAEGRPLVSRGTIQDTTEHNLAELRNERLQVELQQAQRLEAVGRLASGIAHDFNNLLMGITGSIAIIRESRSKGRDLEEALRDIESSAESAAELTRHLLGFARTGRYETEPVNVNTLLEAGVRRFAHTHENVSVRFSPAARAWLVEADRTRLDQVFLNLFLNAAQAMPDGGELEIMSGNVELTESEAELHGLMPGKYVRVSVKDQGIGMDEETRARAFEPFFTKNQSGRGSGLGLASAYGIVRNHAGSITIESEPGRGSTFHVLLPASASQRETGRTVETEIRHGRGTILVIEDEPLLQKMYAKFLRMMGYSYLGAESGRKGIDLFKAHRHTTGLVILDLIMPGLSGRDTFDALRALDPGVKILLASGNSSDTEAKRLMSKGCNGFLQKPFTPQRLSVVIASILGGDGKPRGRGGASASAPAPA